MITVINVKDILKYLVILTICIILLLVGAKYFFYNKKEISDITEDGIKRISEKSFVSCLDVTIPGIEQINAPAKEEQPEDTELATAKSLSYLEKLLSIELGMINNVSSVNLENLNIEVAELTEDDLDEIIKTNLETQVIEEKNLKESYTNDYNSVRIRNESDYELTEDIFNTPLTIENMKDIILFHTHTCESYTPSEQYNYQMAGSYRTTDLNYSVARVGTELEKYLKGYGYNVIHDTTYHDYPAYSGSYGRSLETISNILNTCSAEIMFDLHRDAVGSGSDYAPTVKIGDEYAAQLMFVIGTSGGGLEHENWKENLKFAMLIQQKADELYPGLFRPIMVRNTRYNQHLGKGASIIEVGATGNTLDQCLVSMKYLSKVISEVVQ